MRVRGRWPIAGLFLLSAAMVLASCSAEAVAPRSIGITAKDSGRTVTVRTADALVVSLESNASTGFRWVLANEPDGGVLKLVSSTYVAAKTTLVGASGREVWRFRAIGRGSTSLELRYQRSSGEASGEPFRLAIDVTA